MQAMDCEHLDVDASHRHVSGSSILGEGQVSLCDASMKREASQMDGQLARKALKKRRSSLSSHRRSITGDVVSAFHIDSESGSQTSSESGSQKSSASDGQTSQTNANSMTSLLPNPVNTHLDQIEAQMRGQIAALHEECHQWSQLLQTYEQEEESSSLLAESLTLHVSDIPDDVKQLAKSEYLMSDPVDLQSVKERLDRSLLQYRFDREACIQDLKLIQETVETVHKSNKYWSSCLSHTMSEQMHIGPAHSETRRQPADARQIVINCLNYF
ncbi:hypothetical protein BsWGS_08570 [Bradybaena similaris]